MHLITPCNSVILQTLRFRLEKLKSSMFWTGCKYSLSPGSLQLIRRRVNNIPTSSVTDAWIRHNEVVSRPPPLFASSSTSPHLAWPDSFTCVWYFNFLFFLPPFFSWQCGWFFAVSLSRATFCFPAVTTSLTSNICALVFQPFHFVNMKWISKNYIKLGDKMLMIALFNRQLFLLPSSRRVTMQPLKAKLVLLPYGLWVVRNPP